MSKITASWRNWIAHLITAQKVTGLNPVEVTNESCKTKKTPSLLERFFCFTRFSKRSFEGCCAAKSCCDRDLLSFFKSGPLKDVAQQNPVVTATYCITFKAALWRILRSKILLQPRLIVFLSKRPFEGCCAAKSCRNFDLLSFFQNEYE